MTEIKKVRPETGDPSVSAALHPMVKRCELAREGFHKNYKYILVTKNKTNGAQDVNESD